MNGAKARAGGRSPSAGHDSGQVAGGTVSEPNERSDRAEQIAALVSHELRTPLTVLHAALQLLEHELPPDTPTAARHHLEQALAEARQLTFLTGQLWETTRLQTGALRLHRERLSLLSAVRDVCRHAQSLAAGQRIEISAPDGDPTVDADRPRLEQMLMNLVLNAIVYAPGTPCIDLRVYPAAGQAVVEVQDYGAGLSGAELRRLTRAFYRVPRADRPSRGGLGLGLYLCRELARLHGGRLDVRSEVGQGATFTLRLPLAIPEGKRVREPVSAPASSLKQK